MIEGAFSHLFGLGRRDRLPTSQEIADALHRALVSGTLLSPERVTLAPDTYTLWVHPDHVARLNELHLPQLLVEQIVQLAAYYGFRLERMPLLEIQPQETLLPSQVHVSATFRSELEQSTTIMPPVDQRVPASVPSAPAAHLLVDDRPFSLDLPLITVGRSRDNTLVLDDPHVSRSHAQLRRRGSGYTLFDVSSQAGVWVNGVSVRQHRLQSGDVIRIGKTTLVYVADEPGDAHGMTQTLEP